MVCSSYARPRVAVLICGTLRTFLHPIVHRTLRANLVDAFGGVPSVFLYLKLGERASDYSNPASRAPRGQGARQNETLMEADRILIDAALSHVRPSVLRFGGMDDFAYRTACGNGEGYTPGAKHMASTAYIRSVVGQISSYHVGWSLIVEHERKHRMRFDWVMMSRADLAFALPIQPYCFWRMDTMYSKHDWFRMMPRELAPLVLDGPWREYSTCATPCKAPTCLIENFGLGASLASARQGGAWRFTQSWDMVAAMVVRNLPMPTASLMCGRPDLGARTQRDVGQREFCLSLNTLNRYNSKSAALAAARQQMNGSCIGCTESNQC